MFDTAQLKNMWEVFKTTVAWWLHYGILWAYTPEYTGDGSESVLGIPIQKVSVLRDDRSWLRPGTGYLKISCDTKPCFPTPSDTKLINLFRAPFLLSKTHQECPGFKQNKNAIPWPISQKSCLTRRNSRTSSIDWLPCAKRGEFSSNRSSSPGLPRRAIGPLSWMRPDGWFYRWVFQKNTGDVFTWASR